MKKGETQQVFDKFISSLEKFLDVQKTVISLEQIWKESNPLGSDLSLSDYTTLAFKRVIEPDLGHFFDEFGDDFARKFGGVRPKLNPQVEFRA